MSWADSFGKAYAVSRGVARDAALADAEQNPGTDPTSGYTYANPQDVGPTMPGLEDTQTASMPTQTAPQPATPDQRLQRRASILRQYGDIEGADKTMQANAQLGLTNAQTSEATQRTKNYATEDAANQIGLSAKKRENDDAISAKSIREQVAGQLSQLTDAQGNPRSPTPDELFANQQQLWQKLYAAGLTKDASQAVSDLKTNVANQVKADSDTRKAAAQQLSSQVAAGDFSGVPAFVKRFGYGIGSVGIQSIQPGRQPGMLSLSFTDDQGPKQKEVPASAFQQQMLQQLKVAASDSDAATIAHSDQMIDSQIQAHRAAANASNASASRSNAETKLIGARGDREQTLEDARSAAAIALDKAETDRTPEDQAAIKKWSTLSMLERSRNGTGGAAGNNGARTMNGKVAGRDVTIRTYSDGTSEYLDQASPTDKTATWKPIGKAQAQAAVEAAGGGGPNAAPAPGNPASRPPLANFAR